MTEKPKYAWHVHHDVLVEELTEPIEVRQEYIRQNKPKNEIETRLRLLKPVRSDFSEYDAIRSKAWSEYDAIESKARSECDAIRSKAWSEYDAIVSKARSEYDAIESKAWSEYVLPLHAKECPNCPWNGMTIFPGKE